MAEGRVLDRKVIVVTGAGAGLGRAYAEYLAEQGATVVVNDIDAERAERVRERIEAAGGVGVVHVGSVTDFRAADDLVALAVEAYGHVDGLVNNAGVYYRVEPWADSVDRYRRVIEVNVLGSINAGIAFMTQLRRVGRPGAIVSITSGAQCGHPRMAAYSASKGAVASLTYSWAADLEPSGIRVNAVAPVGRPGTAERSSRPEPVHRMDPRLAAPLVAYLVSDHSAAVTGQVFRITAPELAVMSHPGVFESSIRTADWDVASIDEVVGRELNRWFQPVGGVLGVESARLVNHPSGG
jgi:NAD(P)-dependent dehydrogenase (short-subunit alcohol dehydrogenase family)